jgi:hypothetical protein
MWLGAQSQLGQNIDKNYLRRIKNGWNLRVITIGRKKSGASRSLQQSVQMDVALRASEWNQQSSELTQLQLLQADTEIITSDARRKFMLSYAMDQESWEEQITPSMRSLLHAVDETNSKLNREKLKQVAIQSVEHAGTHHPAHPFDHANVRAHPR